VLGQHLPGEVTGWVRWVWKGVQAANLNIPDEAVVVSLSD